MENPSKNLGQKRYGVNPETGDHFRTDKEIRLSEAYSKLLNLLKTKGSERKFTFKQDYLVFHLNLEDEEILEFMSNNIPGVELKNGEYVVADPAQLEAYLKTKASKPEHEDKDTGDRDEL